jgi:hypothetical protein
MNLLRGHDVVTNKNIPCVAYSIFTALKYGVVGRKKLMMIITMLVLKTELLKFLFIIYLHFFVVNSLNCESCMMKQNHLDHHHHIECWVS